MRMLLKVWAVLIRMTGAVNRCWKKFRAARAEPHLRKLAEQLPERRRVDLEAELDHLVEHGVERAGALCALIRTTADQAKQRQRRGYARMFREDLAALAYLALQLPEEKREVGSAGDKA